MAFHTNKPPIGETFLNGAYYGKPIPADLLTLKDSHYSMLASFWVVSPIVGSNNLVLGMFLGRAK